MCAHTTKRLLIVSLIVGLSSSVFAQGIEFFHGSWPEALAKAKSEEKLIFVDAFASWCGPCKRMARESFPDPKVGEVYNASFICLKIDMEKPENTEFAGKYPVSSYPTLFFIDADGKIVMKEVGAKTPDQLIETAKKAQGKNDKSGDYEKKYKEGNRDPKMLYDYVRALNAAGKSSLKITNEYLGTQQDLTTEFNLRFILEGTIDADSRVFDLLTKYKSNIVAVSNIEVVNARIETACKNALKKAVEYKNEDLLKDTKAKMKAANPERAESFGYEADMYFYKNVKDADNYLKAARACQKTSVKNNAARLHDLTIDLTRSFPEDKKVLEQAEKWARSAAETGGLADYWMTLAGIYKLQGDKKKALDAANNALDAVGNNDALLKSKIDYFIQSLQ